jgi:hypothetical protein
MAAATWDRTVAALPKAVTAAENSSKYVRRHIAPDVISPLAATLKANGVTAVAIVGCKASAPVAAKFKEARVAHQCVDTLDSAQSFVHAHGTAPAAVVRVKVKARPEGAAPELLFGHLLGGLSAPVTAEVLVASDEGRLPVRAALAHPPSWTRSAGMRELWFVQTSVFLDTFNKIYRERIWSNAGGGSGEGSSLEYTGERRAAHTLRGAGGRPSVASRPSAASRPSVV